MGCRFSEQTSSAYVPDRSPSTFHLRRCLIIKFIVLLRTSLHGDAHVLDVPWTSGRDLLAEVLVLHVFEELHAFECQCVRTWSQLSPNSCACRDRLNLGCEGF